MITDLSKQPDYHGLITKLSEKTKARKLDWKTTAQPGVFLCSVQGLQTYKIAKVDKDDVCLTVLGDDGQILLQYACPHSRLRPGERFAGTIALLQGQSGPSTEKTALGDLFDLAKRVAEGIDSKIEETLRILESL